MDMPRNAEVSKSRIGDGVQLEGVFLEEVWVWQASCGPVKLITISNKCNTGWSTFSVYMALTYIIPFLLSLGPVPCGIDPIHSAQVLKC